MKVTDDQISLMFSELINMGIERFGLGSSQSFNDIWISGVWIFPVFHDSNGVPTHLKIVQKYLSGIKDIPLHLIGSYESKTALIELRKKQVEYIITELEENIYVK